MLWGIPDPVLSLLVGLNAKARRVAGLNSLLYKLIISGRVKLLVVENVVSGWWEWSKRDGLKCKALVFGAG
jgi:hypothetical protein